MKQQRNSRQRQLVLQSVREHADHPSADQIYIDVRRKDGKISRGTVYRNLNVLADNGDIRRIEAPVMHRFDRRASRHYHVMCKKCRRIMDIRLPYNEAWDSEVAGQTGYEIDSHSIIFEGLCPFCAKNGTLM